MRYDRVVRGTFLSRPNRFIAKCQVGEELVTVHVKNTGRCKEILVPGARVVLERSDSPARKTPYDLVSAYKGDLLINIDSQAPNKAFHEYVLESGAFGPDPEVFPERTHGDSRFDFYIESGGRRIFAEVKGVTLENDGVCMFPDAPTERGLKHVRGLEECVEEGYEAYLVLVVQMEGMKEFVPNYATHAEFGREMEKAERSGVKVLVLECEVSEDSMRIGGRAIPHRYLSERR
ncbi:MAG: DNA/RNA nuclease SfsA [Candidatus Methanomethylophilaceae archaeon]|nr:DNA/RNA nuclease SfsA [Candidatus Methanomethylophilaceae archaeon]